jgi:hypothetical protein
MAGLNVELLNGPILKLSLNCEFTGIFEIIPGI